MVTGDILITNKSECPYVISHRIRALRVTYDSVVSVQYIGDSLFSKFSQLVALVLNLYWSAHYLCVLVEFYPRALTFRGLDQVLLLTSWEND